MWNWPLYQDGDSHPECEMELATLLKTEIVTQNVKWNWPLYYTVTQSAKWNWHFIRDGDSHSECKMELATLLHSHPECEMELALYQR